MEKPTQQKTPRLLFALVIAAPLADALASALHPAMPDDAERLLAVVDGTRRWYLMSLLGLVASGLVVAAAVVMGRWVRVRSPILGTLAMLSAFVGGVLMASMQGFTLFLPTLARLAPVDGATAVGEFIGSASFAPMVGGFILRALGWILLGVAAAKSGIVSWRTALLVAIGALLAFQLPAGPDAVGWILVAVGAGVIANRTAADTPRRA
ncbi:MAG: hypothetical protein M3N15_06420 [Actinomycetota bacterium]|nr:hypothetical protein [Actinomycetota bacterium]